jgi:hypothetical protein
MRLLAIIILLNIVELATYADGATQTSAFTNSFFASPFSELAVSRTISQSSITSPDLNYISNGKVDADVIQPGGGNAIISQNIYSTAYNNGGLGSGLGGGASFSSKITATNVKGSSLVMTGTSNAEICNKQDNSKIESWTFGLCMAKPNEGEYSLEMNGAQETKTNMAPALAVVPVYDNELLNKELIIAFEQTPSEFDEPVDIIQQEVNFNYGTSNNQPTFYGYDFTNEIAVEDTICSSSMSFSHMN